MIMDLLLFAQIFLHKHKHHMYIHLAFRVLHVDNYNFCLGLTGRDLVSHLLHTKLGMVLILGD